MLKLNIFTISDLKDELENLQQNCSYVNFTLNKNEIIIWLRFHRAIMLLLWWYLTPF